MATAVQTARAMTPATSSREQRQRALDLRLQGYTHQQIAAQLGCERSWACRMIETELKKRGLEIIVRYEVRPIAHA